MGDEDRGQAKLALGALLKASAAQQELQEGGEVSFLGAARAAKAKQDAQKLNKDTKRKVKVAIDAAKKIKKLDLGGFGLTEIPPEVFELTDLKVLWLHDNNIAEVPDDISKLEELQQIRLYNNHVRELPSSISNLQKLSVLWIQNNEMEELPDELGECTLLSVLSVAENKLTRMPYSIGQCTLLRELLLDHNELEVPPDWVRAKGPQVTMKYIQRLWKAQKDKILDLRGLDLSEIPEECLELEDIEELRLSDNKLKTLPEEIVKWAPTLEKLTINHNKLLRLPDVVKSFVGLRQLQFADNEVMDIPNWVGQMKDSLPFLPSPIGATGLLHVSLQKPLEREKLCEASKQGEAVR